MAALLRQVLSNASNVATKAAPAAAALSRTQRTSFQFLGGCHIHKELPEVPVRAENLCMMGDVGDPTQPAYQELLDKATKSFRKVFLLAGRCEYSQKSEDTDVFLEKLAQCYPNVHYMQRSSVMLRPDLIVAGSTLRLHPADSRYGTGMTHAADEMRTKRLEDGRKILYMSYGCPDREHLRLLRPVTGLRVFVCMNKDRDPPVRVIEI